MVRARLIATNLLASFLAGILAGILAGMAPSLAAPPAKHDAPPAAAKPAAENPVVVAETLKVGGPTGQSLTLRPADFAALPHIAVKARVHDKDYTFEGVELTGLLGKVGATTGKDLRGPAMSQVVLATAADGYRLALSLVETDPRFRPNHIIVADKVDGQPLNSHDGPSAWWSRATLMQVGWSETSRRSKFASSISRAGGDAPAVF